MAIFDRNDVFQSYDFERNIVTPYLKEYSNTTIFDRFTGGPDSVIYGKVSKAGQGDDIIYNQRQNFDPTVKIGSERLAGAEDELTYGVDRLRVGYFRFGTKIHNKLLQELQINHKFDPEIRSQLLWQGGRLNSLRIMRQFGLAFCENTRGAPNTQYNFSQLVEKMLACGIDTAVDGEAVSNSRIMFGADKRTNETTVGLAVDKLTNDNSDVDNFTVEHIYRLASLAEEGSRTGVTNKEIPIRPYTMGKSRHGFPETKFLYLMSNKAFFKLSQDPEWKSQQTRGVIENEDQPSILFNSNYKGTVHGTMIVTVPEFSNYLFEKGGKNYGYSAFLGASAMGLGIGQTPTFYAREDDDYGIYYGLAHIEISDAKVLKFPSKGDLSLKGVNPLRVENSLIHSICRV